MWLSSGQSDGRKEQAMSSDIVCQTSLSCVRYSTEKFLNFPSSSFSWMMKRISVEAQK